MTTRDTKPEKDMMRETISNVLIQKMMRSFTIQETEHSEPMEKVSKQLPDKYKHKIFDDFDMAIYENRTEVEKVINRVKILRSPNEMKNSLYIQGGTGRGKTLLACVIFNHFFKHNAGCVFVNVSELVKRIRDGIATGEPYSIDRLLNSSLLVLDDLGAEKTTDFVEQVLYDLINALDANGNKIIITSNISMKELASSYPMNGERIYSRLKGMCAVLKLKGEDRRELTI